MDLFTLEINGQPIVTISAEHREGMEGDHSISPAFRAALLENLGDLAHLAGKPLWNGDKKVLFFRPAFDEERDAWQASLATARQTGEGDDDAENHLAFIVPVVDPTGEDDQGEAD